MSLGGMMQRNPSNMLHSSARVPVMNNPRSSFQFPYEHKTTFNAGYLVPFYTENCVPGDTISIKFSHFARLLSPLKTAIMDNLYLSWFAFFVPYRILQTNFVKIMGEQDNPTDPVDFLAPVVKWNAGSAGPQRGTIFNYFGLPGNDISSLTNDMTARNYLGRAYNRIWKDYFRDENLQDSPVIDVDDGPDDPTDYPLRRRGVRFNYITMCLPFPQKGPDVLLPLTGHAPLVSTDIHVGSDGNPIQLFGLSSTAKVHLQAETAGVHVNYAVDSGVPTNGEDLSYAGGATSGLKIPGANLEAAAYADLGATLSTSINVFRQAVAMQQLLERDARGGTRYTEINRSHFGVVSPDSRLQRPEFLGGGEVRVSVNPVAQTSATDSMVSAQGNIAGFVTGTQFGGFTRSIQEHGCIIAMCSIRADLNYQQNMERHWGQLDKASFYWPTFAGLGEQEVPLKEVCFTGNSGSSAGQDNFLFGYVPRYEEMRSKMSLITGQMRSTDPQTLDSWHLAEKFDRMSPPVLGDPFIQDKTDAVVNRVIAVEEEDADQFLLDVFATCKYSRPMPLFGVPGLLRL